MGLRFAMITTFYPPYHFGGDAIHVRRLCHALARRGHQVEVVHDADAFRLLRPGADPDPLAEPPGVVVHRLESRRPALSCLATQQTGRPLVHGRRIRQLLRTGRFDVIHFHNVSLVGGPGVLGYGDAIKLYTAHEHWLVCPTHVLWRHQREPCTGRECLRCLWRYRRPPQLWRYTGWLQRQSRHVDVFLSPSRFSAEKHREFGFPREMEVLPLFLPDRDDCAAEPGLAGPLADRRYFLFVGRLEKLKGLQDVIPLFGDDAPADLWIAGRGDYEDELRRLARGRDRIRFLGLQAPEALPALYAGALALLAPSRGYEVFPLVLLEAFREGTPVVARRLGPFPEVVEPAGAGLLFADEVELERILRRVAGEPALRAELATAARRAFRERWSEDVILERYLDVIRRVAVERGRRRVIEALGEAPTAA